MTVYEATEPNFDFPANPGRMLQRELDALPLSQAQLAARTGLSTKHINLVIKGVSPISADVAVALEQVLGTPAELWLQLEAARQAHDAREEQERSLASFTSWAAKFPRPVLIERGVIDRGDRGPDVVRKLLRFFEVVSPKAYDQTWLEPMASFKRSQVLDIDPDLTALWLRLAQVKAAPLLGQAPPYDADKLREVAATIPKVDLHDFRAAFVEAQSLLLEVGVVLVFVPEIPNTRISGVTRWVDGTPMIAITSRYKAPDSLWFTLLHEVAHVLLHPKRSTYVDGPRADDDADEQESAANAFVQNLLIPPAYVPMLKSINTVAGIRSLAAELGLDPSLVAGQWAFRTKTWGGPIAKLRYQGVASLS
jgi:HTH-type transcriptional regulator / antitoxin HigA